MSMYEAVKDVVRLAQKADNVELTQKLIDLQQMALDMQDKQQQQGIQIFKLETENANLKKLEQLEFAEGHNYLVDPRFPNRRLCPHCSPKNNTEIPLDGSYCRLCKNEYR
jgi:hypothetical protein